MTKFNRTKPNTKTTNLAGGRAYKQNSKLELVSILLTSFLKDQFYRSENDTAEQIKVLVKSEPLFAAKAAVYARKQFGMRSVSHLVAGELGRVARGENWLKNFFHKVINRPDDMLEILAYHKATYKKGIPNSLKKGFRKRLTELTEYELAKYRGENKDFSLIDLVNLVHPKATPALSKLMKGKLKTAETWETKLTKAGQVAEDEEHKAELKDKAWKDLILEGKIGYFALLRNLRNIIEQSPEVLKDALELLVDPKRIKNSLVLPFRFQTAYNELSDAPNKVLAAISDAADIALDNVPELPGETLVVLDTSGSMQGKPAEIGSLFAAALVKSNDADFMAFSDNAHYQSLNTRDSVMTMAKSINFAMGGTNFHDIFRKANKAYDRIIILSDMQGWMGHDTPKADFEAYKKRTGADPIVYSFDLQGYGSMQLPERNVYCLAGFSDRIFEVMKNCEMDKDALINMIEAIEL